ncbi:MAG: hypothetical protein ABIS14_09730, partial [Sphingomonas sp.]
MNKSRIELFKGTALATGAAISLIYGAPAAAQQATQAAPDAPQATPVAADQQTPAQEAGDVVVTGTLLRT